MEPNKFEKHIKKQMQKREIRPSASAWKKISAQLDVSEEPKNKRFVGYALAASFLGILIVSILFFQSNNDTLETDVQIVDSEKEGLDNVQKEIQSKVEDKTERSINEVQNATVVITENSDQKGVASNKEMIKIQTDYPKPDIIVATEESDITAKKVVVLLADSEENINLKIAEIAAQAELLEMNNDALTDAEVDSLLRKAQQEILAEKLFDPDKSIDEMALLTEVENELDQSFRDQLFESLKTGFIKVRTAVADRNN